MRGRLAVIASRVAGARRAPPARAQHPLVTLPLSDPAYVQLDGLMRQGCVAARLSPYRPYLVRAVRQALIAAHAEPQCAGRILDLLIARFARDTGMVHDTAGSRLRFGALASLIATGETNGTVTPALARRAPGGLGTAAAHRLRGGAPHLQWRRALRRGHRALRADRRARRSHHPSGELPPRERRRRLERGVLLGARRARCTSSSGASRWRGWGRGRSRSRSPRRARRSITSGSRSSCSSGSSRASSRRRVR